MQHTQSPARSSVLLSLSLMAGGIATVVVLFIVAALTGGAEAIKLFIPAFLAGLLSFLSPCTLPVLPAYFAWTFGLSNQDEPPNTQRLRIMLSSLAFFAGLATTMIIMVMLITQAVDSFVVQNKDLLSKIGGFVIIGLGVLSFFGMGFAGPRVRRSSGATLGSAYVYGLTFALGWTACVGPILGSILVMASVAGMSGIASGVLGMIYALGLGLPLIVIATFFQRFGQGSAAWKWLRGRAWTINIGQRTLLLHSTSMISGVLLVLIGILMSMGILSSLSTNSFFGLSEWANNVQFDIQNFFGLN